jgi:YHS domain-containing protein
VKDPERYLKALGLELPCSVDPNAAAVLERSHRSIVNGAYYWASSSAAAALFAAAPYQYTGPVRDPVAREWFTPTASSPRREAGDEILYFESESTAKRFDQSPGSDGR